MPLIAHRHQHRCAATSLLGREETCQRASRGKSTRAQHGSCCCCSVCTLESYVATKDTRWVRWSPWSLGPSPRRPTASCSLAAVGLGDCVRASWLYSFIVQRIDRCSYLYFYDRLVLLLYHAGSAQLDFCLISALRFFGYY